MKAAFFWSAVRNWTPRIGTILTFLVIARILEPEEIGAFAGAAAVIAFLELTADAGLGDAVVQARRKSRATLTAVTMVNFAISLLVATALFLFAGPIAGMLNSPPSADFIRVLSAVVMINALALVPVAVLRRTYDFRRLAMRASVATVCGSVVGIGMAFAGFGAWSMVFQALVYATVNLVMVWAPPVFRPAPPRFGTVPPLVGFGVNIFVSRVLYFASTRATELAIPIFFGPAALGIYFMASRIPAVFAQIISGVMVDVNLPRFSRVAGNEAEFRETVRRAMVMTSAIAAPVFFGLAAGAEEIAILFFGGKGAAVGPVMLPIALIAAFQAIGFYGQLLLNARGRPQVAMSLSITSAAVTVGYFLLARSQEDLETFIWGFVAVQAGLIVLGLAVSNRITRVGISGILLACAPYFAAAIAAAVAARLAAVFVTDDIERAGVLGRAMLVGACFGVSYVAALGLLSWKALLKTYLHDIAGMKRFGG